LLPKKGRPFIQSVADVLHDPSLPHKNRAIKDLWGKSSRGKQGYFGGGADQDRTGDLLNAIQALSQLSYSPTGSRLILQEEAFSVKNLLSGRSGRRDAAYFSLILYS
jgi:hypothetical protein